MRQPIAANDPCASISSFAPLRADRRAEIVAALIRRRHTESVSRLLVVGCGSGREAAVVGMALGAHATGVDLREDFDSEARKIADLRVADATRLPFANESFDLVYSYHALEHISDPKLALREMARVLRPGGGYFIGTPNRQRAIGYLGGGASMKERIQWNLADYRARLAGRFQNELGAHAGFSPLELAALLTAGFRSEPTNVTVDYYLALYSRRAQLVHLLQLTGAAAFAFPSVYFFGRGQR